MKQLVILSGKGGTGKTVLSACFAVLASNKVMADCDVDASNLYLLLHPEIQETHPFFGMNKARIDAEKCTSCRQCEEVCRFDAIHQTQTGDFWVDRISCESCGICSLICPADAIPMEKNQSGEWYVSRTSYGPFVHAKLGIGEENSGKLVTEVRKNAKELAEKNGMEWVIVDGPPGIGCPVIASLSGADLTLVVTEPTPSGMHDMKRVIQVASHFGTKTACCINKYDLNVTNTEKIQDWCSQNSVPVVGKIPYDDFVTKSLTQGKPLVEYTDNPTTKAIRNSWENLKNSA
jgi:MinD superfamily P-loop ATPase